LLLLFTGLIAGLLLLFFTGMIALLLLGLSGLLLLGIGRLLGSLLHGLLGFGHALGGFGGLVLCQLFSGALGSLLGLVERGLRLAVLRRRLHGCQFLGDLPLLLDQIGSRRQLLHRLRQVLLRLGELISRVGEVLL